MKTVRRTNIATSKPPIVKTVRTAKTGRTAKIVGMAAMVAMVGEATPTVVGETAIPTAVAATIASPAGATNGTVKASGAKKAAANGKKVIHAIAHRPNPCLRAWKR
jgi:hypothetical protein